MDYLREGIHLRGFAQIEPLVAYKNEAFELFRDLMNSDLGRLRAADLPRPGDAVDGARTAAPPAPPPTSAPEPGRELRHRRRGRVTYSGGGGAAARARWRLPPRPVGAGVADGGARRGAASRPPVEQRRVDRSEQIGRNDPCWCGSGKKYKKCHGA